MHLREDLPGRLLILERRTWFIGPVTHVFIAALFAVLCITLAYSTLTGLVALGLVLTALGLARLMAVRSVRITPGEVVLQRGWKRSRLSRDQVRRARLEHVRAPGPKDTGSFTLWLEVRDGSGLEAFHLRYLGEDPSPLAAAERLHQALAAFDLRPSLTGDPLPEPQRETSGAALPVQETPPVEAPPPVEPPVELRGLTPSQLTLVLDPGQRPPGARFFQSIPDTGDEEAAIFMAAIYAWPVAGALLFIVLFYPKPVHHLDDALMYLFVAGLGLTFLLGPFHFVRRLLAKKRKLREQPGTGLYLLPEGVMRVTWDQPPVVVSRAAIREVTKEVHRQGKSATTEHKLHYQDSDGHEQVLTLNVTRLAVQDLELEIRKWLEETAPPEPEPRPASREQKPRKATRKRRRAARR